MLIAVRLDSSEASFRNSSLVEVSFVRLEEFLGVGGGSGQFR